MEFPGGTVDITAFVAADVRAQGLRITSSLPEAFATFAVDIDGVVLADLATSLNVTVDVLPNGWYGVTTIVPYDELEAGTTLTIDQTASGAGHYHNVFEF